MYVCYLLLPWHIMNWCRCSDSCKCFSVSVSILVYIITYYTFVGSSNTTVVTSFVNESASITITFSSREKSITFIDVNNGKQNSVVMCLGNPCSCNATEFLNAKVLYNITCGSTFVTVTIKHVQLEQHGDMWRYSLLGDSASYITTLYVNGRFSIRFH